MEPFIPPAGATPIDREKMLTIGHISRRTRPVVREGREHPETGRPWKATTDELGNTQVEHNVPGDRLDARVRVPAVGVKVATTGTGG